MSALQDNYQVIVETYPDIAKKVKLFWGNQEFTDLLHDLLYNTRGNARDGFPLHVMTAFLELQEIHNKVFPQFAEKSPAGRVLSHRPSDFDKL